MSSQIFYRIRLLFLTFFISPTLSPAEPAKLLPAEPPSPTLSPAEPAREYIYDLEPLDQLKYLNQSRTYIPKFGPGNGRGREIFDAICEKPDSPNSPLSKLIARLEQEHPDVQKKVAEWLVLTLRSLDDNSNDTVKQGAFDFSLEAITRLRVQSKSFDRPWIRKMLPAVGSFLWGTGSVALFWAGLLGPVMSAHSSDALVLTAILGPIASLVATVPLCLGLDQIRKKFFEEPRWVPISEEIESLVSDAEIQRLVSDAEIQRLVRGEEMGLLLEIGYSHDENPDENTSLLPQAGTNVDKPMSVGLAWAMLKVLGPLIDHYAGVVPNKHDEHETPNDFDVIPDLDDEV